ncbi:6-phosphofructokinase 3 [Platanthera guangdongensis]|uniref:6-phosphofructokinase 3 n=1 Tax=Platanthera guangdongensis TaxID=2320717 RepID=A0ABR2MIA4_9ASPA
MGSLSYPSPYPHKICAESKSVTPISNHVLDLRSSLSSANLGSMSNGDLKPPHREVMAPEGKYAPKLVYGEAGYCLEDVPHFVDYIPNLPTYPNPLQDNPAYSVVKQFFVNEGDTVAQKIVVHKSSPRGTHFRRAGPRQRVYFESDEVHACIVTCGGLCPGLNTVIRELVCGLSHMYGATKILGRVLRREDGLSFCQGKPYIRIGPSCASRGNIR